MTLAPPPTPAPFAAAPPAAFGAPEAHGLYFDGRTARRRRVAARAAPAGLEIAMLDAAPGEPPPAPWPWARIVLLESANGTLRLAHAVSTADGAGETGERLELPEGPLADAIRAACGGGARFRRPGRGDGRLVLALVAAAVSLVLGVVFGLPLLADRAVGLVPWRSEVALGRSVEREALRGVFNGVPRACAAASGSAAFQALVARLSEGAGLPGPVDASVVDHRLVNAFALPGGRIVVTRGLIERAQGPDELGGVVAHELGHVAARDSMRAILNAGGLSIALGLVLGDFTGSTVLVAVARTLLTLRYSREREAAADGFATAAMIRNGADPTALARFLERISPFVRSRPGGADAAAARERELAVFENHPPTLERIRAIEALAAAAPRRDVRPLLGTDEWAALRRICGP